MEDLGNTTKSSSESFAERLKEAVRYIKYNTDYVNQTLIAKKIGYGRTNLSAAMNGKEEYLTENLAKKIGSSFPQISDVWILTGKGSMLKETKRKRINLKNEVVAVPEEDYMMVEYVDLATYAGVLGGGVESGVETDTRLIPKEYAKGHYLVVRVSGDSMDDGTKRALSEGDEILIRLWQEQIEFLPIKRKLFVINTNEGSVVKQITGIDMENLTITLHSFNQDYEDYEVPFNDIIQIFTVEKIVNSKIYF